MSFLSDTIMDMLHDLKANFEPVPAEADYYASGCGCTGDCGQSCSGSCETGCSGDCGRSCSGSAS